MIFFLPYKGVAIISSYARTPRMGNLKKKKHFEYESEVL